MKQYCILTSQYICYEINLEQRVQNIVLRLAIKIGIKSYYLKMQIA